jgi:Beta-propeller repeat
MHIALARWRFSGFFQWGLCACLATSFASAAVPVGEASKLEPPSHEIQTGSMARPQLGLAFYERRGGFVAEASGLSARFEPDRVRLLAGGSALAIQFEGIVLPAKAPKGEDQKPGVGNFLLGSNPRHWERGVRRFGAVRYEGIYKGIDLVYREQDEKLKADWVIAANSGATAVARIRWSYPGARRVEVAADGSLRVETETGTMHEQAPVAYQEINGERRGVAARFRLRERGEELGPELGFTVGAYDATEPLVIDPSLAFSTYVGGTRNESAQAMAVDAGGKLYVAGYTESTNTPTSSSIQNFGGSVDAYVFCLAASGTSLVYATFIGGTGDDRAYGIDVDTAGQVYVVGSTTSTNFPKAAPLQASNGGLRDAFILKLNASGNALIYSTYFGGSGSDIAYSIDCDPFDQPYIAGETTSINFPLKAAYQSVNRGGYDAFTLKINMNGVLVYSTYLGGSGNDGAHSIAVSNNQLTPYITGYTWSLDFPLWNPTQAYNAGGQDAFLTRFNSDANQFVFSTYLGGSGGGVDTPELGTAIALDPFNNVYVAGTTSSLNFPLLLPFQSTHGGGGQDAWLRKLNSGGVLVYSTYLGGIGTDVATSLRVDANRRAYVGGYTNSANFPRLAATQPALGGNYDAFVTGFESTGTTLVFSTTVGGSGADLANAVAADSTNGNTYVAGSTSSANFPVQAPYRLNNSGVNDIFVAKMTPASIPPTPPAVISLSPTFGSGASVTFTIQLADANGANTVDSMQMLISAGFTGISSCHLAYVPQTNLFFLLNNNATAWLGGLPPGSTQIIQNGQCALTVQSATVVKLGNTITLTFPMTFSVGYTGTKIVYLLAVDQGGLRADWAGYGFWTRP